MNPTNLSFSKLSQATIIKRFDCGDQALNDFLIYKAKNFEREHLAVTYILENEERTLAFFSILNDGLKISEGDFFSKSAYKKKMKSLVTHPKRHLQSFPAVMIGRLAVCNQVQKSGLGKFSLDAILDTTLELSKSVGCKLITVDAYATAIAFYEKYGFKFAYETDIGNESRKMYLDINSIPLS